MLRLNSPNVISTIIMSPVGTWREHLHRNERWTMFKNDIDPAARGWFTRQSQCGGLCSRLSAWHRPQISGYMGHWKVSQRPHCVSLAAGAAALIWIVTWFVFPRLFLRSDQGCVNQWCHIIQALKDGGPCQPLKLFSGSLLVRCPRVFYHSTYSVSVSYYWIFLQTVKGVVLFISLKIYPL